MKRNRGGDLLPRQHVPIDVRLIEGALVALHVADTPRAQFVFEGEQVRWPIETLIRIDDHRKPVAGTGWFLVAKTDQREATANSQLITRLIVLLTIGLILGTGSFFAVLWHSRDKPLLT